MTIERGRVRAFDPDAGHGLLDGPAGDVWFHCTAIAGGGRHIDVGTAVVYRVVAGHGGRWEATDVTPVAVGV